MKSVLISIQPKWCELIANGKKTVEVRKTRPKLDTPFKVYIYCTKSKSYFARKHPSIDKAFGGGMVIGEFLCNCFTYIEAGYDTNGNKHLYNTAFIEHRMCIPDNELHEYLYKSRENTGGWGWHISDLVIYEKPRELSEFYSFKKCTACESGYESTACIYDEDCKVPAAITRPPQSWCYVEGSDNNDE